MRQEDARSLMICLAMAKLGGSYTRCEVPLKAQRQARASQAAFLVLSACSQSTGGIMASAECRRLVW